MVPLQGIRSQEIFAKHTCICTFRRIGTFDSIVLVNIYLNLPCACGGSSRTSLACIPKAGELIKPKHLHGGLTRYCEIVADRIMDHPNATHFARDFFATLLLRTYTDICSVIMGSTALKKRVKYLVSLHFN